MLRVLRIALGILLVIFGLAALVTPLTPGAWLGLIGLELLGFGFLIPQKVRDIGEKTRLYQWYEKKRGSTDKLKRTSKPSDNA